MPVCDTWVDGQLRPVASAEPRCFCPCHEWADPYPTSRERPCAYCGHAEGEGRFLGTVRDGWTPNAPRR